jgi:hypothetical protein
MYGKYFNHPHLPFASSFILPSSPTMTLPFTWAVLYSCPSLFQCLSCSLGFCLSILPINVLDLNQSNPLQTLQNFLWFLSNILWLVFSMMSLWLWSGGATLCLCVCVFDVCMSVCIFSLRNAIPWKQWMGIFLLVRDARGCIVCSSQSVIAVGMSLFLCKTTS